MKPTILGHLLLNLISIGPDGKIPLNKNSAGSTGPPTTATVIDGSLCANQSFKNCFALARRDNLLLETKFHLN
jgi:hypothetical protein